jgi:outer membrane protein OmpA-like peptidoglycan-associated protein
MRRDRIPAAFVACVALALTSPATAQPAAKAAGPGVTLNAVEFPERNGVDVPFAATDRAPAKAFLEASVKIKEGQASIDLSFKRMAPALLFGGDVTSYVVWAVTRDGIVENLGELWVRDDSGSVSVRTGQKTFGLLVTAEAHPFVTKPSSLVIFTSQPAKSGYAKSSPVTVSALRPAPRYDEASIAGLKYRGREPVDLVQAAKVLAQAEALDAGGTNAERIREARTNLAQATNSNAGGSSKAMFDYARRSMAKSGEAIRNAEKRAEDRSAAEASAKRKAELDLLAEKATSAEEQARLAAGETRQAEKERAITSLALSESEKVKAALGAEALRLEGEKARLEAEQTRLKAERDALAARLSGALAKVAEVRSSGRGLILSLSSGILFDVNRAALRPAARVTLAKLAGILLILSDLNLRVEGFTDATGKAEANQKLSKARAESVAAFLKGQGVAEARMKAEGYGPANPVASNDTAANKSKNRRVEIVLAEGEIKPANAK